MFTLVRESVAPVDVVSLQHSWPVRITATSNGDPAPIFVYHTAAAPLGDRDFFSCIASAMQMTELPEGSGAAGVPFYRVHQMLVQCRSEQHAYELFTKVKRDVQLLADNLALVDALQEMETVTITPTT